MASDLKLFLNDNADTFAAWLKNVLQKLKLVTKSAAAKATGELHCIRDTHLFDVKLIREPVKPGH